MVNNLPVKSLDEIFKGLVCVVIGNIPGNISTEINNRFPEIFPSENFWEFLKIYMKFLKIAQVH